MTSNDLKMTSNEPGKNKRIKLKGGNSNDKQNDERDHIEQGFSSKSMAEFK